MKPISKILQEIREGGLIYHPFVTAAIISYEAGHFLRNAFYAAMIDESSESEQQLKAGWLANAKVELSDLITQCRVIAAVYEWDWTDLIETGEAKLVERIETYKTRGVRPNDTLLQSMRQSNQSSFARPSVRMRRDGD